MRNQISFRQLSRLRVSRPGALASLVFAGLLAAGCGGKEDSQGASEKTPAAKTEKAGASKGVGPIKHVELGPLDLALAAKGEQIYSGTCAACHKLEERYVGPPITGVTLRRTPEWIMNMIMNPIEMTQKDETAKAMLAEYMTQMSVSVNEEDARAILEYFRKIDGSATDKD